MHGQRIPEQRTSVVASWPQWMREEYQAQVDALLWTRWYARPQAEALALQSVQAMAARREMPLQQAA